VEVDETYIGGKYDKRRARQKWDKESVFGMVERGGIQATDRAIAGGRGYRA
jgi:hypothetical protein